MLFRYPSAAATHLVDCCIVRLRTMSTGVASSSPQECLSLIKTNITAAVAAIGSAKSMASPAPGESPLEGFLTVMGLQSRTIVSNLSLKDDLFKEALKGNLSHNGDNSFDELANIRDHIFKCAESFPPAGTAEAPRQAARNKMSGYLQDMCCIMALGIR